MLVTHDQPLRTGGMSEYPYDAGLEAAFRVVPKYEEPFSMAKRVGNILQVPRNLVPVGKEDFRVHYPEVAIDCQIEPRDLDQAVAINKSIELLKSGHNHILEAPTGWGKTYAGIKIACGIGAPTLIVVTKSDLIPAWHKAIRAAGYGPEAIGHLQADKCIWKGKQFVLAMVQSLIIEGKYEPEMFRYFGMVIFDEVHRMAADKFSIAAGLFPAYHRLGLSATPDRKDGKDPVLEAHIGPMLVKGKVVPMAPKVLVKKTGWKCPVQAFLNPGKMMGAYKMMTKSAARNKEIADFVVSCYNAGRTVVVMHDLVDNGIKPMFHVLVQAGIPGEAIGEYISGKKPDQLEAAAHRPVVLTTKKMCSEGTNYEHWDSLVLCTPSADVEQMIGRIMRRKEGKKQPVFLDLVDADSIMKAYHYTRLKTYAKVGAEVVSMD